MLQKFWLSVRRSDRDTRVDVVAGQELQESKTDYAVSACAAVKHHTPATAYLNLSSPYVSPGTCWPLHTMTALPCVCLPASCSQIATFPFGTRLVVRNSTWRTGQLRAARGFQRSCNSGISQHSVHCTLAALQGNAVQPQQPKIDSPTYTPAWDVVGLGQAMVDLSATVDDDFLVRLGVVKGSRRVISAQQRAEVLQALDATPYQVSAGGSLSNSLIGLSRLGHADNVLRDSGELQIAMAGGIGSDSLGSFFSAQAAKAGVTLLSDCVPDSCTGTAIVLTTPDANRTFLSYLGEEQDLQLSAASQQAIAASRMLIIEGYMWEVPNVLPTLLSAAQTATRNNAMVALTAGDSGVVHRHRQEIWSMIDAGVDMLFCNRSEAAALLDRPSCTAEEAALALGPHCKVTLVTDGARGSCISAMGLLQVVPPCWTSDTPIDTCGAGDGYAAGALYGLLCGYDLVNIGRAGARVASSVILKQGGTLSAEEASRLVQTLPNIAKAGTQQHVPSPKVQNVVQQSAQRQ